jgi:hypothetical protein
MPEQEVLEKENGSVAGPMAAIAALPGLLGGALEDIRTIAKGMSVLPELARILGTIEARVERLDDEVMKMRRAVESMGADVGTLPARLGELQDSIPLSRKRRSS